MEKLTHWTNRSEADFIHAIAADFVAQIETKMEDEHMERKTLAGMLGVSSGRVSQVLNDPSSLNLRTIVKYARALDLKVAVVTYNDGDINNERGPIDAGVFSASWQRLGCPQDLFEVYGIGQDAANNSVYQSFSSLPLPLLVTQPYDVETGSGYLKRDVTDVVIQRINLSSNKTGQVTYAEEKIN